MSKTEILNELSKLTREDRREIVRRVHELDGDDWLDEGELSDEERALLESRLADHERNPDSAIPWEEFEPRLSRRLGS
jgi:putative addiction module component (TIGR02574 family)